MADESIRLNVTLPAEQSEKLTRIAARTHVREGTLASSLLTRAIEEADPDPTSISTSSTASPAPGSGSRLVSPTPARLYIETESRVVVVSIEDGRAAAAAITEERGR